MRFKKAIFAALLIGLSSCGWMHTTPKASSGFKSKALDMTCVKEVPGNLDAIFSGTITGSDEDKQRIVDTFGCIDHALNLFSNFTRGASESSYQATELQSFANRVLPENSPINDAFINSIFQLKRSLVGGDVKTLTKEEIKGIQSILNQFGAAMAPFAPSIKTLITPAPSTPAEREAASRALDQFMKDLSGILSRSANPVDWADLRFFIRELGGFSSRGRPNALSLIHEQVPIYQYVKLLVVGGSENSIESEKWLPILSDLSQFYSAFLLTANTAEMIEKVDVKIDSSEAEQARASSRLIEILKEFLKNGHLQSQDMIRVLADRMGKAFLLNAVIFPRTLGSLNLRPLLETPALRKAAADLIRLSAKIDLGAIDPHHPDFDALKPLLEQVFTFLERASIADGGENSSYPGLNPVKLGEFLDRISPLLTSPGQLSAVKPYLATFQNLAPFIIGGSGDSIRAASLRPLYEKGLDLYGLWTKNPKPEKPELLTRSLDIVFRAPTISELTIGQIQSGITEVKALLKKLSPDTQIDWAQIQSYLDRGMVLKAALFGTPADRITGSEIQTLVGAGKPFLTPGGDPLNKLLEVANALDQHPLGSANIADLIPAVDAFLPPDRRISSYGLSTELLGALKAVLVGGNYRTLAPSELPQLIRTGIAAYRTSYPEIKKMLDATRIGLNAETMLLVRVAIQDFVDLSRNPIELSSFKVLVQEGLKRFKLNVREVTVDKFLSGLHTRILKRQKYPKPSSLEGLTFESRELLPFVSLAMDLRDELLPLEAAYLGRDYAENILTRDQLLQKLPSATAQSILKKMKPILNGTDHHLHFAAKGEVLDKFNEFDLAYKFMIFKVVNFIFPLYKVSADPAGQDARRLNETDLTDLLTDLNDLITELKLSYGYERPERSAKARLQSINIFTSLGNGDDWVDTYETTEFLTITIGGKNILQAVERELYPACAPDPSNPYALSQVSIGCLTRVFYNRDFLTRVYGTVAPELVKQIRSWDENGIALFRKAMLDTANHGWTENGYFQRSNMETFTSIPFYTENLFQRFDLDQDDTLRFSELMNGFPIFCRSIQKSGGKSLKGSCEPGQNPRQIEALYGYLIFKGGPPKGTTAGSNLWQKILGLADILLWFNHWKHLDKDPVVRDREPPAIDRKEILKIMSNLAS